MGLTGPTGCGNLTDAYLGHDPRAFDHRDRQCRHQRRVGRDAGRTARSGACATTDRGRPEHPREPRRQRHAYRAARRRASERPEEAGWLGDRGLRVRITCGLGTRRATAATRGPSRRFRCSMPATRRLHSERPEPSSSRASATLMARTRPDSTCHGRRTTGCPGSRLSSSLISRIIPRWSSTIPRAVSAVVSTSARCTGATRSAWRGRLTTVVPGLRRLISWMAATATATMSPTRLSSAMARCSFHSSSGHAAHRSR